MVVVRGLRATRRAQYPATVESGMPPVLQLKNETGQRAPLCGDDGQDLIEYALLAGLIAMVAIGAVTALGATVRDTFWTVIAAAIP
jgi:Flp pilus assembly pilin Flp